MNLLAEALSAARQGSAMPLLLQVQARYNADIEMTQNIVTTIPKKPVEYRAPQETLFPKFTQPNNTFYR